MYHNELIEDDLLKSDTAIIVIPQEAPKGSILRNENIFVILNRIKKFNIEWVKAGHNRGDNTNNVSATISIDKSRIYESVPGIFTGDEWKVVGRWMWENKNSYNGISVLPYDGGTYKQAPFEDCSKEVFDKLNNQLKDIDLTKIIEDEDNVDLQNEIACAAGACEIK